MVLLEKDVWRHLDNLTKPPRSLGKLEELAARLCCIQGSTVPKSTPRKAVLFAGDHGVVKAGVSAWPSEVTALMIQNILAGTAASTVLARATDTPLTLVNVGSLDLPNQEGERTNYRDCRVCAGTADLAEHPAMTVDQFHQALEIGKQQATQAAEEENCLVIAGEMGIGNTTPSACLAMLLASVPLQEAVGRGAGADDPTWDRKRQVVAGAVDRARRKWDGDPIEAIAEVAGLEIVAMAGFFVQAKASGLTILLDG
ncbi:MAG: nicotinate-nucleotide--dimethylbenzimidazole phosphoribosyltransferase, partial [Planctomycetales bacterium]